MRCVNGHESLTNQQEDRKEGYAYQFVALYYQARPFVEAIVHQIGSVALDSCYPHQ